MKNEVDKIVYSIDVIFNISNNNFIILYYISQCLFVCPLPFFSATAEPFVLKLAVSLRYGVGKTAKHFGT